MHLTVILAVGVDSALISTHRSAWQSAGYVVIPTESTKEAIAHFRVGDFDVVLLGQAIPKEDKEKLAFLVRASGSRTPVICLAGATGDSESFADAAVKGEQQHFELLAGLGDLLAKSATTPDSKAVLKEVYSYDGEEMEAGHKNKENETYTAKRKESFGEGDDHPDRKAQIPKHDSFEHDLRHALERNEMTLHYQPKIDLKTGAMIGAEALSRWIHPTRGSVPPARFIPIAEQSGLILQIGAWVLREACTQARAWVDAGLPARTVAVNISANQLEEENFLKKLFAVLNETGLDPANLELDVTANVLMKRIEQTAPVLKSAQNLGVKVTADNLGASYPNFSMLRKMHLNALKIDRPFVRRIGGRSEDKTKVSTMINLGHRMNLRVIAEGVETVEQLEFLWEHGCDEAQGYYLGQPMPGEQLLGPPQRSHAISGMH